MQISWTHLYERLLFLERFAFGVVPDFSDIAGLFDLKPRALGLSRVLVCGLGFSPAQPRALAVRLVLGLSGFAPLAVLVWHGLRVLAWQQGQRGDDLISASANVVSVLVKLQFSFEKSL